MTYLEIAGYIVMALSGLASVWFLAIDRGRAISLVFLYLLAYHGMEMFLKWEKINYFNDLSYMSFALVIDMFWFYFFYYRSLHVLSLIIGFDVLYTGFNLYLLGSGIGVLDVTYGHVGVAVSVLLIIGGVYRGMRPRYGVADDSWDFNLSRFVRALPFGKRAKS